MPSPHDLAMLAAVVFFCLAAAGVVARVGWAYLGWAALTIMLGVGR
jgi:hypothetical protein